MSVESLREVRDHFSDVVDRVQREHDRVTVIRNGKAAAVILNPEDLAQLQETLAVLSDAEARVDIREADQAYREGNVVRGAEAVRALRQDAMARDLVADLTDEETAWLGVEGG